MDQTCTTASRARRLVAGWLLLFCLVCVAGCHCRQQAGSDSWLAYERSGGIAGEDLQWQVGEGGRWCLRDGELQHSGTLSEAELLRVGALIAQLQNHLRQKEPEPPECCDQLYERARVNGQEIDLEAVPLPLRTQLSSLVDGLRASREEAPNDQS